MQVQSKNSNNRPWAWIPSLYFASGLPYVVVMSISVIMYKRLGISNTDIALYTSWLYLPWIIKPLWSPIVDILRTKRAWIIAMQLLIGAGLGGVALTIPTDDFFRNSMAFLWLLAFSSATHDIAADGFYMLGLSRHDQTWFVGIRSTFYRLAMIAGQGLLIMLAGAIESAMQTPASVATAQVGAAVDPGTAFAWSIMFYVMAGLFVLFFAWHNIARYLRRYYEGLLSDLRGIFPETTNRVDPRFSTSFQIFRGAVSQTDSPVSTGSNGAGRFGTQHCASRFCLRHDRCVIKRWLLWMVVAINLPNAVYIFLSTMLPDSLLIINIAIGVEQFGYGFGFAAYMLYMLYISNGAHQTAHYAICTGFMALGMMIPGMFSGWLQESIGYQYFFIWVLVATIPSFIVATLIPLDKSFGKKETGVN